MLTSTFASCAEAFGPKYGPNMRAYYENAREHDVILLGNHGSVVYGEDLHDAVNKAEALELMCRMLVARTQGFPLLPIAEELRAGALREMDE